MQQQRPYHPPVQQAPLWVGWLPALLGVGLASTLVRIIVVTLWVPPSPPIVYEVVTGLLSVIIIGVFAGAVTVHFQRIRVEHFSYDRVASAITTYVVSTLVLLLGSSLLESVSPYQPASSWYVLSVLADHLIAVGTYAVALYVAGFMMMVLLVRRHKRTRFLLQAKAWLIAVVWFMAILAPLYDAAKVVAVLAIIALCLVMLGNIRRLNWLGTLSLNKKVRLFWLATIGMATGVIAASIIAFETAIPLVHTTEALLRSGSTIPAVLHLCAGVFFFRLMIATLASLPNSGLVDRRTDEMEALAALTRRVAQAISIDELLETASISACTVCQAHGSWVEVYDADGAVRVVGARSIGVDYVHYVHSHTSFHRLLTDADQPMYVESLTSVLDHQAPDVAIRSLLAVPLWDGRQRMGTLVVFSTVETGMEPQDLSLLASFADVVSVGLDQARLVESALANERVQKEVEVARNIQQSLLPTHDHASEVWTIDAITIPAAEVGGDYYDYVRFADGSVGALIADVAGKGVPAALYMATLKGVVLAEVRSAQGPADLLRRIHGALWGSMERKTYITMTCIAYDPRHKTVRIARAGHTPALITMQGKVHTITPRGVAIGIISTEQFHQAIDEDVYHVEPGDICLLTTDGVTERRNGAMVEMTLEPLTELLYAQRFASATDVVRQTLDLVEQFAAGTVAHDDITIVGIRFGSHDSTLVSAKQRNDHDQETR